MSDNPPPVDNNKDKVLDKLQKVFVIITALMVGLFFFTLMAMIVIQVVLQETDYAEAAEMISTYTGIVLGFVAMAVSLIGMVLSFFNTIQNEKNNLETFKQFTEVEKSVENVRNIANDLTKNNQLVLDGIKDLNDLPKTLSQVEKFLNEMQKSVLDIREEQIRQGAVVVPHQVNQGIKDQKFDDQLFDVKTDKDKQPMVEGITE